MFIETPFNFVPSPNDPDERQADIHLETLFKQLNMRIGFFQLCMKHYSQEPPMLTKKMLELKDSIQVDSFSTTMENWFESTFIKNPLGFVSSKDLYEQFNQEHNFTRYEITKFLKKKGFIQSRMTHRGVRVRGFKGFEPMI